MTGGGSSLGGVTGGVTGVVSLGGVTGVVSLGGVTGGVTGVSVCVCVAT